MGVDVALTGVPQFDKLELVKTGFINLTMSAVATTATASVNHNLGYTPVYLAYMEVSTFSHQLPLVLFGTVPSGRQVYDAFVDENTFNARVTVETSGDAKNVNIRYYLFRVTSKTT